VVELVAAEFSLLREKRPKVVIRKRRREEGL